MGGGGVGLGIVRSMALPYPVLTDRERETYRAYGLTRALHLFQESATFLVDREGIVRHATHSHNPNQSMDWPALLADVRAIAARDTASYAAREAAREAGTTGR